MTIRGHLWPFMFKINPGNGVVGVIVFVIFIVFFILGSGCHQIFQIFQLLDFVSRTSCITFAKGLKPNPQHFAIKKRYAPFL